MHRLLWNIAYAGNISRRVYLLTLVCLKRYYLTAFWLELESSRRVCHFALALFAPPSSLEPSQRVCQFARPQTKGSQDITAVLPPAK